MINLHNEKAKGPEEPSRRRIAAIVPALNEEASVGEVLKVLLTSKVLNQVILVDDGSTDKTAEIGEKLGAEVIRLPKIGGSGKGNAMKQGLKATDAEIIVFFDADLVGLSQEHISSLVEPMLKGGFKMCVGIRDRFSGLPKIISAIDPLLSIAGERAIERSLLKTIPEKFTEGFAIESALNHHCFINNFPVKSVLLEKLDHISKEKKWGFSKGFTARVKMIFEIVKIRFVLYIGNNNFKKSGNYGSVQKNNFK